MQELERAALPWEASDMKVDMEVCYLKSKF